MSRPRSELEMLLREFSGKARFCQIRHVKKEHEIRFHRPGGNLYLDRFDKEGQHLWSRIFWKEGGSSKVGWMPNTYLGWK